MLQRSLSAIGKLTLSLIFLGLGLVLFALTAFAEQACPFGTLLEPYTGICAPVKEVRLLSQDSNSLLMQTVPNLKELREKAAVAQATSQDGMPTPGGIGAGILYRPGKLRASDSGVLYTQMFYYSEGIEPSNVEMEWLFTTSTNRMDNGNEFVGIYHRDDPQGAIGIFDWSCSVAYPCQGGQTGPDWVWIYQFMGESCYLRATTDQGGHRPLVLQYANETKLLASGKPPRWQNVIYFWNRCDKSWDLVYKHVYREYKDECSIAPAYSCSFWGPILETFNDSGDPVPTINELGFAKTVLVHDGVRSDLGPDEATYSLPWFPWQTFHLDPNRGFGVGNRVFVLANPSFELGAYAWSFYTNGQGSFTVGAPAFKGAAAAQLAIDKAENNIQLYQSDLPLAPNTRYRLTFSAYSSKGHDLAVYLHNADGSLNYGLRNFRVNLTSDWRTFQVEFKTKGFTKSIEDARLRFWLVPFAKPGDHYAIDSVVLEQVEPTVAAAQSTPTGTGALTGRVQLSAAMRTPITITLSDLATEGETYQSMALTDEGGAFHFDGIPYGAYELKVNPPTGYTMPEPVQLAVTHDANEEMMVVLELVTSHVYLPLIQMN